MRRIENRDNAGFDLSAAGFAALFPKVYRAARLALPLDCLEVRT